MAILSNLKSPLLEVTREIDPIIQTALLKQRNLKRNPAEKHCQAAVCPCAYRRNTAV